MQGELNPELAVSKGIDGNNLRKSTSRESLESQCLFCSPCHSMTEVDGNLRMVVSALTSLLNDYIHG